MVAVEDALVARAAAIADYADTSIFVPDRDKDGRVAPPEWFRMNPDYDKDSAEVIASSAEEEGEAEDKVRRRRQKTERATSLSSTAPPATSRVRRRRLPPETIKPRLPSRPPRRLTPPSPPTLRTRMPPPRLPSSLSFVCFDSLRKNLLIRTIPPAGCILNLYSIIRPKAYVM